MLIVYGTPLCHDCRDCVANLRKAGIPFDYRDITASLKDLKEFLFYRDHDPEVFVTVKENGSIGIPCLLLDGKVFLDWESHLREKGFSDIEHEPSPACSIDGGNC